MQIVLYQNWEEILELYMGIEIFVHKLETLKSQRLNFLNWLKYSPCENVR